MVHRETLLYGKMHEIDCIAIHYVDDGDDTESRIIRLYHVLYQTNYSRVSSMVDI
jgi:hypothetical protein